MQLRNVPTPKVPLATILRWPRLAGWVQLGSVGESRSREAISSWMAYRGGARRPLWLDVNGVVAVNLMADSPGGSR